MPFPNDCSAIKPRRPLQHWTLFLVLLVFPAILAGCLPLKRGARSDSACLNPPDSSATSRISFFLNIKKIEGPQIKLQLLSVEILQDGLWIPVSLKARELDSKKIGRWQLLLGQKSFKPGTYEKVKLTFSPGVVLTVRGESSVQILAEPVLEIPFPDPFILHRQASEAVFLVWDVDASFAEPKPPQLAFNLSPAQVSPITANQIYIACPDINTIYSASADKKWVDRSFYVAGRPTYIAIDDAGQKLFVLCRDDGDIKILDLVTGSIIDVIELPMTFRPKFMLVDADLTQAYVLDDLGHISVVDLQSGTVITRKKIGQRPNYAIHLPETRSIAVSSSMDNSLYLLDDQTLDLKETITVGSSPAGILGKGSFLYIAEELSDSVTIFDSTLRSKVNSVAVGSSPHRLVGLDNKVYVANYGSGSVSLLRTPNNRVADEIKIGDHLFEMMVSEKEQIVYVGKTTDRDCGSGVSVLDITSGKVLGEIELGSGPMGIALGR